MLAGNSTSSDVVVNPVAYFIDPELTAEKWFMDRLVPSLSGTGKLSSLAPFDVVPKKS